METQQSEKQPQDAASVEVSAPQTEVETVPLAEVQKWLDEQIKPYLQRIEKLEEITSKKDSQIHCLELALQRFQQLVTEAKLVGPANNNNNVKIHPTAVNGIKRPSTAVPTETKEDKKPITKPTPVVKPAVTGVRPQTATNQTTEKKEEDNKKHPVIPHKITRTPVKQADTNADEEKKPEETKKIEKKPVVAVKKEEDKKPAKVTVPAATEKKPVTTPKPVVKKEDPKAKKEVATPAKDEKKLVGAAKNTAKKQEEPAKPKEEDKKTETLPATVTKSDEKPAEKVDAAAPATLPEVSKEAKSDEKLVDSAKPKAEETSKQETPEGEEEESI